MLDDALMEKHYDSAERSGQVSSTTSPLVLLGKCGAGKTSLSHTLRDRPLPLSEAPQKTQGLEEMLIEVSHVDYGRTQPGAALCPNPDHDSLTTCLMDMTADYQADYDLLL